MGLCEGSDDDDEILFRYSLPEAKQSSSFGGQRKSGSGGLAPSKSTVYVSNLDYTLTNSDLHTIFSTFGKVARVSVVKDRATRASRGLAFILFVSRADAAAAVATMDGKILNGRTLKASIAVDNGRAAEFIRRRVYHDKSRCYECGECGHLSYECPRNILGPRERPNPKKGRRRNRDDAEFEEAFNFEDDNWASVVDTRGADADEKEWGMEEVIKYNSNFKKQKQKSYFSDESSGED